MRKFYNYVSLMLSPFFMGGGRLSILLLFLSSIFITELAVAQTRDTKQIQGIVLDEAGQPLAGVTVTVPGSTGTGTNTGKKGDYRMLVPRACDSLRFSFIGYQTLTIAFRNAELVRMKPDIAAIDDVVVTGIFTRKAENYTGSTVTVSGKDLKRVGNQNVFQSLKSLDPSLNIFSNLSKGSDPNALPDMQLRGTSTFPGAGSSLKGNYIGDPNVPLFILDGFETTLERVFNMDMNRISSLTILKDASAKAIYGSKAANGVVVIETKPLLANQTRVTYNGSLSIEMPDLTSYDLCNALEKLQVEKYEGYYDDFIVPGDAVKKMQIYNRRMESALAGNSTYWLSKPLHVGVGHKHNLSVELGENAVRAIADFSYNDVKGVMKGSDRQVVSGDVNLMYRYKKLLFKNIMSLSNTKGNDSPYGSFSQYAQMNPYWSPYDENGQLKRLLQSNDVFSLTVGNPLYDATLATKLDRNNFVFSNNFYIEAELLPCLKAIVKFGISGTKDESEAFYPSNHSKFLDMTAEEDQMRKGSYSTTYGKSAALDGKFDLQFNKTFNKHALFANLHYELYQRKFTETSYEAEGFPSDKMTSITYARQYAKGTTPQSYDAVERNVTFMGFLSYSYDDRYVIDVTGHTSAASAFGDNNKWGTFYSVGGSWNIHNESFLENVKDLSMLRVRASYGSTGNPNFATSSSYALYKYNTLGQYNNYIGAVLQNMENPDLMWEKKKEYNIGIDASYKRFNLRADYYNATTSSMVTTISIVPSTGFNSVKDNLGEARNRGFEFNLSYSPIRRASGFLTINASIVTNKNFIIKLSDNMRTFNELQMKLASENHQSRPVLKYVDGMPLKAIWATPSLGIDPMTGKEIYVNSKGERTYDWSANDMVYCGQEDPKYKGIIGINGEYKGFGLGLVASYEGGSHYYNYTLIDRVEDMDVNYNVDRRVLTGRWIHVGQHAQYTSLHKKDDNSLPVSTRLTSRFVQKRNELSLTSITAYYEFNQKLLNKLKCKQLKLAFYLNDVATFSTIKLERGTAYPFSRSMSISLTGTF